MKGRVAIGNHYASVSAWRNRWKVVEVIQKADYPDHVRLQSLTDDSEIRLISVSALLDRSRFVPIAAPVPAED